jgi:hypothetical protein
MAEAHKSLPLLVPESVGQGSEAPRVTILGVTVIFHRSWRSILFEPCRSASNEAEATQQRGTVTDVLHVSEEQAVPQLDVCTLPHAIPKLSM